MPKPPAQAGGSPADPERLSGQGPAQCHLSPPHVESVVLGLLAHPEGEAPHVPVEPEDPDPTPRRLDRAAFAFQLPEPRTLETVGVLADPQSSPAVEDVFLSDGFARDRVEVGQDDRLPGVDGLPPHDRPLLEPDFEEGPVDYCQGQDQGGQTGCPHQARDRPHVTWR